MYQEVKSLKIDDRWWKYKNMKIWPIVLQNTDLRIEALGNLKYIKKFSLRIWLNK